MAYYISNQAFWFPEVAQVEKPTEPDRNQQIAKGGNLRTWKLTVPFPGNLTDSHKSTLHGSFGNPWKSTIYAVNLHRIGVC